MSKNDGATREKECPILVPCNWRRALICVGLYYFPTLKTENVLIIPKYYNGLILGNYDGLHSELDKLKREVEEMKKLYKELFEVCMLSSS